MTPLKELIEKRRRLWEKIDILEEIKDWIDEGIEELRCKAETITDQMGEE